jgi:anti-sigma-K factor RskA
MGRPTKLTKALAESILGELRAGATRTAAAESNGIPRETLSRWMARFVTFRHEIMAAEAQAEVRATITLRQAGETDWKAALAWLERRRHADWGKVDRVEIEIKRAAARIAAQTGADPDWLVKRAAEIAENETGVGH